MLSKLLKYELKATGRIFLPFYLTLLIFAGITKLVHVVSPEKVATPTAISMAIYVIIMVGMFVMTFIMMINRFYKNLLSDEGYLMLTLPVKHWQHIVSKLLVSMLWIVTSVIAAFISILIIALEKVAMTEITWGLAIFYQQFFKPLGTSAYLISIEAIIGILVSLASGILLIYASIAIGHLFNQHKILASFGAFIVLNTLAQILFMLISFAPSILYFSKIHITSNDFSGLQAVIQLGIGYGIIFTGLLSGAYFTITNNILSKRLNLE
ncbi:MAG: hypothetical protein ACYCX4_05200 [Bacillota bacterium]